MRILVTGGTGFIGQVLCRRLAAADHQVCVVSRRPEQALALFDGAVEVTGDLAKGPPSGHFDAVISLAGEPVFGKRWTPERKATFVKSRVDITQQCVRLIEAQSKPPEVFISASAIGFYGERGDETLGEDAGPQPGNFFSDLCSAWENAATTDRCRTCLMRIGLVLSPEGGVLGNMLPAFRAFAGGHLGNGRQYMPWIHMDDAVRMLERCLSDDSAKGPYNVSAPHPVTNKEFSKLLGKALGRPAWVPIPAFGIKAALGEMGSVLLGSQRVVPNRMLEEGFEFNYPTLQATLDHLLSK